MSVTGKGSLSIRKQDVREQKNLGVGFKKLQFAHKATLGATSINLNALTAPTEMSSVGFVNPSASELQSAQLNFYRKNFTLVSSIRGVLMDFLSYNVSTDVNINLVGFTAADGEIFIGTIDYNARNGQNLVDAAPLVVTGTITNSTDFNVGQYFEVNKYPSAQVGAVIVYRNGVQQFRNSNNSSTTLDGNYYEVNNGSGVAQIIRFNVATPISVTDSILVVSNGLLAYNPDGSALQQIQALAGKIDTMIPTLADLAGVPQTNFQAAPSSVDLKSFGDRVLTLESQAQKWITAGLANAQNVNNITPTEATLSGASTSGFSTSGNAIILPSTAFYCFAANTSWSANGTGYRELKLQFSTDGGAIWTDFAIAQRNGAAGSGAGGPQISIGKLLNANTWIRGVVYQNSGGALSTVSDGSQNNISIWLGGKR